MPSSMVAEGAAVVEVGRVDCVAVPSELVREGREAFGLTQCVVE
jgi:hypothetical protein